MKAHSVAHSFFSPFLQEELREMREQPVDPQAEQEIIDSIEEVYFSSDSFDMVRHELEVRLHPSGRTSSLFIHPSAGRVDPCFLE